MRNGAFSKINAKLAFCIILSLALFIPAACNNASAVPSSTASNSTTPVTTTTKSTVLRTNPPTVQELEDGHFLYPEIPRITAEQIKLMINEAQSSGRYVGAGAMVSWDDFIIIDARKSKGDIVGSPGFSQPGHILGARSMPMTWYWVTDPREDPKPEEVEAYQQELTALEENIQQLPKNLPIYIYDGTADDEAACIVAQMLLDAGFNPDNVKVIWKGFSYWYYDLQYPVVQGDYNFEGE